MDNSAPRPVVDLLRASDKLSAKQREVLSALREFDDGALVSELADTLEMHANTVRGHLDELMDSGVVESELVPGSGRGRPRHRYRVCAPRRSALTNEYVSLVEVLAETLEQDDRDAAREMGRRWAERSGRKADPVSALRDMGFAPQEREEDGEIGLTACPFITPDGKRPNPLICAMHEGYLRQIAGTGDVTLMPFDRPGQCGARFS